MSWFRRLLSKLMPAKPIRILLAYRADREIAVFALDQLNGMRTAGIPISVISIDNQDPASWDDLDLHSVISSSDAILCIPNGEAELDIRRIWFFAGVTRAAGIPFAILTAPQFERHSLLEFDSNLLVISLGDTNSSLAHFLTRMAA